MAAFGSVSKKKIGFFKNLVTLEEDYRLAVEGYKTAANNDEAEAGKHIKQYLKDLWSAFILVVSFFGIDMRSLGCQPADSTLYNTGTGAGKVPHEFWL